jgi:S1-C subfamily serine protease
MIRTSVALAAVAAACLFPAQLSADDHPTLKEALALEEAMEQAIREAEPAVACVLVSRSEAYQKWFGERPHADHQGKLGDFQPSQAVLRIPADELPPDRGNGNARLLWLRRHATPRDLDVVRLNGGRGEEFTLEQAVKRRFELGDRGNVPEAFGSGVVLDREGLILTTFHVVRGATKLYVRLPSGKGSYADIHAADPRSDLAVLRLLAPPGPLKPIKFGDGDKVRKGQWVLALANPYAAGFRDGSPSASWGIVSNVRRRAPGRPGEEERQRTLHQYGTLIQTDARLTLGSSGGALINLRGEMIGLTTALAALTGGERSGGFAIPLDRRMKPIIETLRRGEEVEYGFLGVSTDETRDGNGVVVTHIVPGSPAAFSGLLPQSRILRVNGMPIQEVEDVFLAIGGQLSGSEVELEVFGRSRPLHTSLVKLYVPSPVIAANRPEPFKGLRIDHPSVGYQRLSGFEQHMRGIQSGALVSEVLPNSPAQTAGLKVDDLITAVDGRPVTSPASFYEAVRPLRGPVELTLTDLDGRTRTVRID